MTSYTSDISGSPGGPPLGGRPLTDGPQWYRSRIRAWGPLVGLVLPALIGALAYASLEFSDASWSGALGLVGGVAAAPGLLVVGAPFGDSSLYLVAVVASSLIWLLVGFVASRRATRHPMATWGDFWRHYLWMAVGIWIGSGIALGIATIVLGEDLL